MSRQFLARAARVAPILAGAVLAFGGSAAARTSGPRYPGPVTPGSGYLALGDSVSFGYMEPQVVPAPDYRNAASFPGYPELLGAQLRLKVANAACPGETSSSLIRSTAQSNGCENTIRPGVAYRRSFPLHVRYSGAQLSYGVHYLKTHSGVRLVSLMIGANDLFACQETTTDGCLSSAEQAPVLARISRNVRTILRAVRREYAGEIAIVDYYSLNYGSALVNSQSAELNRAVNSAARPFHVRIANAFASFRTAAAHSGANTCTAGLLTQLGAPGTCGVHPSYAGQTLLAATLERVITIR